MYLTLPFLPRFGALSRTHDSDWSFVSVFGIPVCHRCSCLGLFCGRFRRGALVVVFVSLGYLCLHALPAPFLRGPPICSSFLFRSTQKVQEWASGSCKTAPWVPDSFDDFPFVSLANRLAFPQTTFCGLCSSDSLFAPVRATPHLCIFHGFVLTPRNDCLPPFFFFPYLPFLLSPANRRLSTLPSNPSRLRTP